MSQGLGLSRWLRNLTSAGWQARPSPTKHRQRPAGNNNKSKCSPNPPSQLSATADKQASLTRHSASLGVRRPLLSKRRRQSRPEALAVDPTLKLTVLSGFGAAADTTTAAW